MTMFGFRFPQSPAAAAAKLTSLAIAGTIIFGCAAPSERAGKPMSRAEFMQSRTASPPASRNDDMSVIDTLAPVPDTSNAIAIPQPPPSDLPIDVQPAQRDNAPRRTHPAALALLNEAMRQEKSGDYEMAAAKLERALRIEPRSALLWNRLANIRLQQGQRDLAANLAAKSNSYASNDTELIQMNQRIIAGSKSR